MTSASIRYGLHQRAGVTIIPFQSGHLTQINLRPYELSFLSHIDDLERYSHAIAVTGYSFSGVAGNGSIIACAGIYPIHLGVGEAWITLSDEFDIGEPSRLWASAAILIKTGLWEALTKGFHRIQTAIPADFKDGYRFATHCGFEDEGLMKKYGPDRRDFVRFARTG